MTTILNLDTGAYRSRVLDTWLSGRDGGHERAGLSNVAENGTESGMTADQFVTALGIGAATSAGVNVTRETAMRVSAVYACVSRVAGAIASMPVGIYERSDGDRRKARDHDYWWMFNEQACEGWSAYSAWEYVVSSKLFEGDGFARWIRPSPVSNRVIGWEPLHPRRVQPFFDTDGAVYYRITPVRGAQYVLDASDVMHLPSLGFDGLTSPSPITYAAREAIGTATASQAWAGRFFSGGANFDFALKTGSNLQKGALDNLYKQLLARLSGNSRSPLILTGGLEPAQLSVNAKDAEVLSSRLFSVTEICSILGVPPHMIGHTEKTTSWGSGIEQQGLGFVRYTLMPHLVGIAQELNRKLWPSRERYFVEHVTAAMERGDVQARSTAYRAALGRAGEPAWMTVNEVRRAENMPPIEGGDTINRAEAQPAAQPAPGAA